MALLNSTPLPDIVPPEKLQPAFSATDPFSINDCAFVLTAPLRVTLFNSRPIKFKLGALSVIVETVVLRKALIADKIIPFTVLLYEIVLAVKVKPGPASKVSPPSIVKVLMLTLLVAISKPVVEKIASSEAVGTVPQSQLPAVFQLLSPALPVHVHVALQRNVGIEKKLKKARSVNIFFIIKNIKKVIK